MSWRYDEENKKQKLTYNDIYLDLNKKLRGEFIGYLIVLIAFLLLLPIIWAVVFTKDEVLSIDYIFAIFYTLILLAITVVYVKIFLKKARAFIKSKDFMVVSDVLEHTGTEFSHIDIDVIGGKTFFNPRDRIRVAFKDYGDAPCSRKIIYFDKAHESGYFFRERGYDERILNLNRGDEFYLVIVDNKVEYYYSKRVFELEDKK